MIRSARPYLAIAFAVTVLPPSTRGQSSIPDPSFEDLLSVRGIGGFALSPDGRSIAYEVRGTNWKENRYQGEIWLARAGAPPFQLTRSDRGSSRPRWSPDGQWIAFLSDRGNGTQIHLIRPDGGEATAVTSGKEGINGFEWAPDGKHIAFLKTEPERDALKQRKERYGEFTPEDEDYRQTHLWLVPVVPDSISEPTRLTGDDSFTVTGFAWSPDGTRIVVEHQPDPLITSGGQSDLSMLDVASKALTPLVTTRGGDGNPVWSPDGRWIVYSSDGGDTTSNYYKNGHLLKIPAGGGPTMELATDLDEERGNVTWAATGLYLVAWQKTERRVFLVDQTTGRTRLFASTPRNVWGLDFSADGKTVAFTASTPSTLTELYRSDVGRWQPVAVTSMSDQIAAWDVGTSEVVSWKSTDGTTIEGVLHKPKDFDATRRYPLLVVIHGGPTGIDYPTPIQTYVYPISEWLAKGALVLRPNYRGSAGYGETFRSLNVRNLGVGDEWDVMSGVDALIKQGIVDSTRMGAMGWSQGGYISAFLTTTTTRFKAISVGAGISDWMTYYVNTDIHPFTRQYLKATPWTDPAIYAKTSPITYITKAKTPTLIQHGEFDRRVPIPNAYELYQGLQDVGVPSRLIVYKGFGHGITKPKERLAAMWHNWQWFAKYVWGEEVELPLTVKDTAAAEPGGR
jgi:dipeptidyl aminopeptidase/acylaminoacyl peptidase